MFKTKVGSDPCLVLTGTINLTDGEITLDQTFTVDDLNKALKTKTVSLRCNVVELPTAITIGFVVSTGSTGFKVLTVDPDGTPFAAEFANVDGVWTAALT